MVHQLPISYTLRRSTRSRHIRINVTPEGAVVVTAPIRIQEAIVQRSVREKGDWIRRTQARLARRPQAPVMTHTPAEYRRIKEHARRVITSTVDRFCVQYKFRYRTLSIRNQVTRWGSCSKSGSLQFNYRLVLLPEEILEYVVVHELCHLREMNHSQRFWEQVAAILPAYQEARTALRSYRLR